MANAHNRKRAPADDVSQEHRPYKKIKSRGRLYGPSNFPPEFWDNLSKVPLTRRALRELDRRNSTRPAPGPAAPAVYTTDLARFARHGGPDLRRLRGCPEPKGAVRTMASSRSTSSSRRTKSAKSTKATDVASKTKPTSAYDDAFELHAIDNGIYPEGYEHPDGRRTPEPNNIDQLLLELAATRASLSPSQFPDSAFRDFKKKHKTASESTVKYNIIPIIAGNTNIPNKRDLHFTNIQSITGGLTVKAVPDFFDGARLGDVHPKIRNEGEEGNLNKLIIPTKHTSAPVVPNFFLEIKAPKGGADVAQRQALHDGAIGSRAMHALMNYGKEEPAYDSNAYTYSSTYHAGTGTLQLYAHHVTPPAVPRGRPEYHMTQVKAFAMTNDLNIFVQGATAFRNARDHAQRHRGSFIQAANARARQSDVETSPEAEITVVIADKNEESTDEFVDCEDYHGSQAVGTEDYTAPEDVEEPALPQDLCAEDEEPSQGLFVSLRPQVNFPRRFYI
ncbi:hypothetical protein B0H65DRAFT_542475 [Neurospora tetraspora]|uniref:DUF7924 domain-containing protein n=1 Tax=Neurospora tetraspora TaxID=94610 RepID=A0AAE0J7L4_9PEZI|nr:hypothetical protein B0H65DRAFT_542475 [Neurospora tetraspora]